MPGPVETMTDYLAAVRVLIDQHGWLAIHDDHHAPPRCYSVGLTGNQHPEIILLGFDPPLMTRMINRASKEVMAGKTFADWSVVRGIVTHYPVVFREVCPQTARRCTNVVARFFAHYRVLQMFLPDVNGQFPWQANCHPNFKRQIVLDYVSTADRIVIL